MRGRDKEARPGTGRRRSTGPKDTKDRWMITYADLITLLLIFFVVMYAMSRIDVEKYEVVTQSLQHTFKSGNPVLDGGTGVLDGGKGALGGENSDGNGQKSGNEQGSGPGDGNGTNGTGQGSSDGENNGNGTPPSSEQQPLSARELAFREQEQELATLMGRIESYIKDNQLEDQIMVTDLPKGISITLSDQFLFDIGRADLKTGSEETLLRLSSLFRELNTVISIEGHTDNQPVGRASAFEDNWELSGARALSVLRFFLEKEQLDPEDFQYAGYADTRPAADNTTAAGRQKNRRVEITVLRQLQQ